MSKYAYSIYIDNEDYLLGLESLYYSWYRTESINDFVILKTNKLSTKLILPNIQDDRIKIIEIPQYFIGYRKFIANIDPNTPQENGDPFSYWDRQFTNTLGQFYAFNLIQYESILNLHCDMLIKENLDYLFEKYNEDNTFYVSNVTEYSLPFKELKYNKVFFIDCFFWIIKPNPSFFNKLENNYSLLNSASNANEIAEKYIYPDMNIKRISFEDSYAKTTHNTGPWKYWIREKNFNPKKFLNKDEIEKIATTQFFYSGTKTIKPDGQKLIEYYKNGI